MHIKISLELELLLTLALYQLLSELELDYRLSCQTMWQYSMVQGHVQLLLGKGLMADCYNNVLGIVLWLFYVYPVPMHAVS